MGSDFQQLTVNASRRLAHSPATTTRFNFFDAGRALASYGIKCFFARREVKGS